MLNIISVTGTASTFTLPVKACLGDNPITLTGQSPTGGTFSGSGVFGSVFNPNIAGVGPIQITYSVDDINHCANKVTKTITVNGLPSVTLADIPSVCVGSAPVALSGGLPVGGTYTGTGVINPNFDPMVSGAGTFDVTYTYTDATGCTNNTMKPIKVNSSATVTAVLKGLPKACINAAPFKLTQGQPAGGTYFENGIALAGSVFNPATSGIGKHAIKYSVQDATGCSSIATDTIEVVPVPTIVFPNPANICLNSGPDTLKGASPAGGTYTGTAVTGNVFDPTVAGVGPQTLTYSYTDPTGCAASKTATITVIDNKLTPVSLADFTPVCLNGAVVTLSGGLPAGGTYKVNSVLATTFNPAVAGVGTTKVVYTFTDANTCTNTDTADIVVNALPTVSLKQYVKICNNATPITLNGGSPVGGTYTGTGVSGGVFTPSIAGKFNINYAYTDANGCSASATDTIRVIAAPTVTLGDFTQICGDAAAFNLSGGLPAGGTYSGTGVTNGVFDPAKSGSGTFPIRYSVTANGCTAFAEKPMVVTNPNATKVGIDNIPGACSNGGLVNLTQGYPAGGIFAGPGVSGTAPNQKFDPAVGSKTITYSWNLDGCAHVASTMIVVNDPPVISVKDTLICAGMPLTLVASGATTYNWTTTDLSLIASGQNSAGLVLNPIEVKYGPDQTIVFTVTGSNANGCTSKKNVNVYFKAVGDPSRFNGVKDIQASYVIGEYLDWTTFPDIDYDLRSNYKYNWMPKHDVSCDTCPMPLIDTKYDENYVLTIKDIYGCFSIERVNVAIDVSLLETIDVPDAFTPNGDKINDVIYPDGFGLKEVIEFTIYNRWGDKVHQGKGTKFQAAWDGTISGREQQTDEYAYVAVVTTHLGNMVTKRGKFKLIR